MESMTDTKFSLGNLDAFMRPGATIERREERYHAGCWVTLNGWVLSVQWGCGKYSDNYKFSLDTKPGDSTTAEIALWKEGTRADLERWGTDTDYPDTVLAYVSMARVQHILDLIERDELVQKMWQPPTPQPEPRAIDNWVEPDVTAAAENATTQPLRIDTSGYAHTRLQTWHKDNSIWEVWASHDGRSWSMLGMQPKAIASGQEREQ